MAHEGHEGHEGHEEMENAGRLDGGYEPTGVGTIMARARVPHPVPPHETC